MGMRGRFALLAAAVGLGACARVNPAFGDEAEGASAGQGATSESAIDSTDGTTGGTGTSQPMSGSTADEVASTGTYVPGSSSGGEPSSSGGAETESVEPPSALLWVSALTMGTFAATEADECADALENNEELCAEPPFEIVGRAMAPLVSLPEAHPFLEEAEFVSARTGEFVLADFSELLEGRVEPEFLGAMLLEDNATSMFAWRGPVDRLENSCTDWTSPENNAPAWYFEQGLEEVSLNASAPCMSELRVLCACPARTGK